jgi:hypothetical protein
MNDEERETLRNATGILGRLEEMAEKGEISGQVFHYIVKGEWPKTVQQETEEARGN